LQLNDRPFGLYRLRPQDGGFATYLVKVAAGIRLLAIVGERVKGFL
jgi:hypothetical protein